MTDEAVAGADAHDPTISDEGDSGDLLAEVRENVARLEAKVEKERAALAGVEEALAAAQSELAEVEEG